MRDMFGLTLLSLGVEPANATVDDVQAAQEKLLGVPDGHFRGFYGNEYYDALAAGDLAISVAWSGDVSQMNLYDNDKVQFVVPESGGMRWNDNLVIPKGGANLENAHKLLNYYYDPVAATTLSEYVGYFTPVNGRRRADRGRRRGRASRRRHGDGRPATRRSRRRSCRPRTRLANTYTDKELTEDEETQWNDLFEAVLGA